jgi:hypothetical protein
LELTLPHQIQRRRYRFGLKKLFAALLVIVIANIVAAYLVHKGVLPKPSNTEKMRNLAILDSNIDNFIDH